MIRGLGFFVHKLCRFEQLPSTQTQGQAALRCEVFIVFLSAAAFAIESKRFGLGVRVFEKFALFHLFNKTSITKPKVLSFPS